MIEVSSNNPVICWWSGGITSAVACHIAVNLYGVQNCRFVFLDTFNEHDDSYRFKEDCENWYGSKIESLSNEKWDSIQEVWYNYNGLNFANGAICSSELKRDVRLKFQKENSYSYQVFGFDIDEINRARSMKLNYQEANPIFPLLLYGLSKDDCITYVQDVGIEIPEMYKMGFENNNCWKTSCVQGGIGYWQRMKEVGSHRWHIYENIKSNIQSNGDPDQYTRQIILIAEVLEL